MHSSEQHCTLRRFVVCFSGANNESDTFVFLPRRDFLHVGQTRFPSLSNCSCSTKSLIAGSFAIGFCLLVSLR